MSFINVGASDAQGKRIPTKAALKRALKEDSASVTFDRTSAINLGPSNATIKGDKLPEGDKLTVVGPDPYSNRRWYATVYLNSHGNISVN
ncbi:hypothetical protein [Streptomyces sp. H27-C3]|uniref:hypothetical protein n=1 Tax=Streptomyces sp. H27-C3 TaxID=3046305 RepID=UPI0024B8CB56|nr:hypothetical protein [Streptomyces sp. H27-C3]MDJ0463089.1 hypothetical protein [Streptomyces sp. H27-C3]